MPKKKTNQELLLKYIESIQDKITDQHSPTPRSVHSHNDRAAPRADCGW